MPLTELPTIITMKPDRPAVGGPDHPMRLLTAEVANSSSAWTPRRADEVSTLFDSLASTWKDRDGPERHDSLLDALDRGGPFRPGPCIEVGSGAGLATPVLRSAFDIVIAFDLSREMLAIADPESPRVRADSSTLPIRSRSVAVVALVNMFLFPAEVDRVLAPGGALVWVNSSGTETPIHLPAEDVVAALGGTWTGVHSGAGVGTWAVVRRA
jgi:SAM-dependent methyltransferase